jgi:hypothetical protein
MWSFRGIAGRDRQVNPHSDQELSQFMHDMPERFNLYHALIMDTLKEGNHENQFQRRAQTVTGSQHLLEINGKKL